MPGIPADAIPFLFEPGVKTLGKASLRADSGLGLPFCRMAAECMGGSMHVESNTAGTTFELRLPSLPAGATVL